ncbi:MAG TPA: VOC family protein [Candidatus Limnocylindria bacterium]|jgi:catechol-2,3-dioxygenase|nr:VOC family protein [Candidatus Limnocylindria bacterium]
MPSIARLGHVGLHCDDLLAQMAFYRDVLGLQVTDQDVDVGLIFLSSRPQEEHHELVLAAGRSGPSDARILQQVSFRCDSLEDVREYYRRFKERGVKFDMIVTHGNAVGIYFYDPEGNRCEVYWATGLAAKQPFLENVDLEKSADEIMAFVSDSVAKHGVDGYVDTSILEAQNIPVHS